MRMTWLVFLGLFSTEKKYSHYFIKLRLNYCSHMDYFNNIYTTLKVAMTLLSMYCRVLK